MTSRAQRIRDLLAEDRPLVLGGAHDGLPTRLADRAGFEVLFIGGFSIAALDEAIARGQAARDLGADAVFVEAPESAAELERIARVIPGPKVANMVEGGRTPLLAPDELHALGFDLIVTPLAALLAGARAVRDVYAALRRTGTLRGRLDQLLSFDEFNDVIGLEDHYALERRFKDEP